MSAKTFSVFVVATFLATTFFSSQAMAAEARKSATQTSMAARHAPVHHLKRELRDLVENN
jgi:hypothetical protein|nr:MAG TPA: Glycine rich protein family [Caudoviricetes sp.]